MLLPLILFLSWICFPSNLHLLDFVANVSVPLHKICQENWEATRHFATNGALMCGAGIEFEEWREPLVGAGLYHMVLFSGFHVGVLESLFRRNFGRSAWTTIGLGFFALMSGWPGRVVRAFVRSLLRGSRANPRTLLMRSWLFCIAFHPQWIHSLSLHLSAAAGLAFMSGSKSYFRASLKVFFVAAPLFAGWAPLHPWIPVAGIFLAPFALTLWASEAAVELFVPRGLGLLNRADDLFRNAILALDRLHPPWTPFRSGSDEWGWFYILLLFFLLHLRDVPRDRRKQRALR